MVLRSVRTIIRPWHDHDDDRASEWPPYFDPFEPLWNLSRPNSNDWYHGFDWSSSRRTWAVENHNGQLLGRISLRDVNERDGRARLGITFGAPFVGQGLGTEALLIFLDYYFADLHFDVLVLDVAAPNERAVRSYERLGFQHVSTDWRGVPNSFDRHVLQEARYTQYQRFFREDRNRMWVMFYEMELPRHVWQARRQQSRRNGG